jgi:hypothetical protein
MSSAPRGCTSPSCTRIATDRCFDCGSWLCDDHRTAILVPTKVVSFREEVCATCLRAYFESSGPYGPISLAGPHKLERVALGLNA